MKLSLKRKQKKLIVWLSSILSGIIVICAACGLYVNDYYRAENAAIQTFYGSTVANKEVLKDGTVIFSPDTPKAGLIFYPGGKVEHTAYEPLMFSCMQQGIACILVEMPLRLAVLDKNAAKGLKEHFPEIENWFIGGHSLGGSMAASYLKKHADEFNGLILLGAYSTADLSQTSLRVLSMYGSEDKVLNEKKYQKYKDNLPQDHKEFIINGGNHAYFGMYGEQDGDGKATLTNEKQIKKAAQKIIDTILA